MATFSPLYTGRDSAVKFPELDKIEASQRRTQELQIRGGEMKLTKALKDEESFRAMLAIDPITAVSTKNATDQAVALEGYNTKWAQKYTAAEGNLSFADKMEMQKDKSFLQGIQKRILSDQEQYFAALQSRQKDTQGYWDKNHFAEKEQEYFNTGILPRDILSVAPQNFVAYLDKQATSVPREPQEIEVRSVMRDGKPTGETQQVATSKVAKETAQNSIFSGLQNEGNLKRVLLDFEDWYNTADKKEVSALLGEYDKNQDGIIDPESEQYVYQHMTIKSNPIVKWAINNPAYLTRFGVEERAPRNIPKPPAGGNFESLNIGRIPVKYQPTERQSFKNYTTYHPVLEWPSQNIPTDNVVVFKPNGEKVRVTGKTLTLQLTGYDENTDEFTFITKTNYWSNNTQGAGDQISMKRKYAPEKFNDFVILINGIPTKVRDVERETEIAGEDESLRADGTKKGDGFLGVLKRPDGDVSTELSISVNIRGMETEIPTLIPTLTESEKKYLLTTPPDKIFTANPSIFNGIELKAIKHAEDRISKGLSPFKEDGGELDDL